MEEKPEINEEIAQNPPALNKSEKQGSKPGNGSKIAIIILAILATAGLGFGIYEYLQVGQAKQQIADLKVEVKNADGSTTTIETSQIEVKDDTKTVVITDSSKNDIAEVKKVAQGLYEAFVENNIGGHRVFGDGSPLPIEGTDIITSTSESYGFTTGVIYSQDIQDKALKEGETIATNYLTSNGFSHIKDLAFNSKLYYNQEKEIYCTTPGGSYPYSINCTKYSWLPEDDKKLALELAEAANTDTIIAKTSNIENSPISPYQRLVGATSNAALLFYRVSPSDKWQFVAGTQMILNCNDYNEDAKKAFSGTKCWDEASNSEITL